MQLTDASGLTIVTIGLLITFLSSGDQIKYRQLTLSNTQGTEVYDWAMGQDGHVLQFASLSVLIFLSFIILFFLSLAFIFCLSLSHSSSPHSPTTHAIMDLLTII